MGLGLKNTILNDKLLDRILASCVIAAAGTTVTSYYDNKLAHLEDISGYTEALRGDSIVTRAHPELQNVQLYDKLANAGLVLSALGLMGVAGTFVYGAKK